MPGDTGVVIAAPKVTILYNYFKFYYYIYIKVTSRYLGSTIYNTKPRVQPTGAVQAYLAGVVIDAV